MHPLLTRNRFGLYLLAWVPLVGILTYVLASGGRMDWLESAALVIPLCLIYAFIGMSTWYSVKSSPLGAPRLGRIALTHVLAAALVSLVWVQLGRLLAYLLSSSPRFLGLPDHFAQQFPIVFTAGFFLYLLSVTYHYVLLSLEASREAEARVLETNVLAREAELKALKAQVNPHFLFNSLNSISALTSIDPAKARQMCIYLADFLRLTLGLGERNAIPFEEELSLIDRFLAIETVRFGSRLRLETKITEESKKVLVLPLILQPLIENAILHGIANLPEGGAVRLTASCPDGILAITVENSRDPDSAPSRLGGMGLSNVRRRLEARYGDKATLSANAETNVFRVVLRIPVAMGAASR
jgi:two-component system, LytTR family, sensor histidine kinase AlgZ